MFTQEWAESLISSTLTDTVNFLPEVIVCATIVLLLLFRLFRSFDQQHLGVYALVFTLMSFLVCAFMQWQTGSTDPNTVSSKSVELFGGGVGSGGLLVLDHFATYLRMFILFSTCLVILQTLLTGIPDREDSADFYVLLLGAALGMCLMVSSNHLLMFFIAVEMASLPSYALAGFLKGKRQGSEASLKYVVYGSGASGIMLFGISLLAGRFGTGYLPDVGRAFVSCFHSNTPANVDLVLVLGILFFLIGLGFKLAAVPFHFWCPDVFEGAAAEVAGFLSVASKGAAIGLLARFVLVIAGQDNPPMVKLGAGLPSLVPESELFKESLRISQMLIPALSIIAAVTATFGNLAAYAQTNLKRLLAYSTIAHAGYMLMGLTTLSAEGVSAVLFYLVAYLLMNLGAFAVVAFIRNVTGSEDLDSYRGLIQRAPVLVVAFGFFLFSLLGVPPLVGFAAKFQIFQALFDAGNNFHRLNGQHHANSLEYWMYGLVVVGGINTVFSLFYYVKVLKVMILDAPHGAEPDQPVAPLPVPRASSAYALILALLVLLGGVMWGPLVEASDKGADRFYGQPGKESYMSLPPPPIGAGGAPAPKKGKK